MSEQTLPLLPAPPSDAVFIWHKGQTISSACFLRQAQMLAQQLPEGEYAINLCEDRYLFLLVFVAMLLRGQVNLLPANRSLAEVRSVAQRYGDCLCVVDREQAELGLRQHVAVIPEVSGQALPEVPAFPAQQSCAVVFTSGSTGESQPWEKGWGELYYGAWLTRKMLALDEPRMTVVATVPPQHMYGLEMTIILPLVTGLSLHDGRPFYPHDLLDALQSVPEPRLLVTTPVHLNACLQAGIHWPRVARLLSATAPLSPELATQAEQAFEGRLHEIYGSSETGAVASRRTRDEPLWRLHEGIVLKTSGDGREEYVTVQGGPLPRAIRLNDRVRLEQDGRFALLGRSSDMLKIAGKRVSLGDLNHKLQAIPGVEDGVFIESEDGGHAVTRLCAVVVAPSLTARQIIDALKQQVDPLCLPRPLYRVERLPRNGAGKLPRKALLEMLEQLRKG